MTSIFLNDNNSLDNESQTLIKSLNLLNLSFSNLTKLNNCNVNSVPLFSILLSSLTH